MPGFRWRAIGTPHEFAENAKYDWGSIDTDSSVLKILRHLKRQGRRRLVCLQEPQPEEIPLSPVEISGGAFEQSRFAFFFRFLFHIAFQGSESG